MALTSPCAVGSLVAVTVFTPSPTILPCCTMTAANGPPFPDSTLLVASAMARRRNSGLGSLKIANLLTASLTGESNHSMSQAFCSTRVLTAGGLAPATFFIEGERIVDISRVGKVGDTVACRDF